MLIRYTGRYRFKNQIKTYSNNAKQNADIFNTLSVFNILKQYEINEKMIELSILKNGVSAMFQV
jgi:hypothetical protein